MDTIFLNGNVVALDRAGTVCEAVGVVSDRIAAIGTSDELRRLAGRRADVVDLGGRTMLPGFIDSHDHLTMYGYMVTGVDCGSPANRTIGDIVGRIGAAAAGAEPGEWVKGHGYCEYKLEEHRHITRRELDEASPNNPAVVYHTSYHSCLLNSLALEAFGITGNTPDPVGGEIVRDSSGEPMGVLNDAAMMEVFRARFEADLRDLPSEERVKICSRASQDYASAGITTVHDAMVRPLSLRIYQEALERGQLFVRVYTLNMHEEMQPLIDAGICRGFGDGRLRIGAAKIFYDGGLSCRTALVSEPYLTAPGYRGLRTMEQAELEELVGAFHERSWQVAIHSQGDVAIRETLEVFERVMGRGTGNPCRHRIEHAGGMFDDMVSWAAELGIVISSQPGFFSDLGDGYLEALGPDRGNKLYPFRSMIEAGVVLGGSSDSPVSDFSPLVSVRDAVLRRTASGEVIGPNERLTVEQALRMYTNASAYLSFEEDLKGSIEVGKLADFVVLAENPLDVEPAAIASIPVEMTVLGGKVTYRGPSFGR